jgi:beta-lactamase superfamily II metal-dependent hydrolase
MITPGTVAYFAETTDAYKPTSNVDPARRAWSKVALLWGDPVFVTAVNGATATVSAKGHFIDLPVAELMEQRLLSLYQIDCGQGDAALVHFPDDRWAMVDGGPDRGGSNSGKIAADFLYWKAKIDQSWRKTLPGGPKPFRLDAVVCSHPDLDHFGGFVDMTAEVRKGELEYGTVFHCGLGRFTGAPASLQGGIGFGQLGPVKADAAGDLFETTLLSGFGDVQTFAKPTASRPWVLDGGYGDWLRDLLALKGAGVGAIRRVHQGMGHLPGYAGGPGQASVTILGPVQETLDGKPALRHLDGRSVSALKQPSLTRNGHSVVLRIDYGKVRILLTGDLNFRSQALLLKHVGAAEFKSDVAKACHHGAEDVSATFLKAMSPLATLISSGDNETYAHPRARMLGMTGAFAQQRVVGTQSFLGLKEDKVVAPLIYSTELSRSIQLFEPDRALDGNDKVVEGARLRARPRTPSAKPRVAPLPRWLLGDRLVYGLINVRTDGSRILIAVMNEGSATFHTQELVL